MDCKKALEEANGDVEQAKKLLRERGLALAEKRSGRTASQGLVESYIHAGGRIGSMVEVNCETDFVARTDAFRELAHDVAMQVAATGPSFVSAEEVPAGTEGDPRELALLEQPFIKDPGRSIKDLVNDVIAKTGENVKVARFVRFELGQ
jgi:elongation factor Ts